MDCFVIDVWTLWYLNQASESNTYADIEASYKCLKEKYGVKDDQLILYGQSVGSGPTVDLASRTPNLRGVVLQCPILSGMRVLYPVKCTYWFDIYKVIYWMLIFLFCFWLHFIAVHSPVHFHVFFTEYWQDRLSSMSCISHPCKWQHHVFLLPSFSLWECNSFLQKKGCYAFI